MWRETATSLAPAPPDAEVMQGTRARLGRSPVSELAQMITELARVEGEMRSLPPVLRRSAAEYVVNPAYAELAELEHQLLEGLTSRGMRFSPREFHLLAHNTVEWSVGGHGGRSSHGLGALDPAVRLAKLRQSVSARAVIGQAQGILMERYGLSADEALARLREMGQGSHRRMHAVALQVTGAGASQATTDPSEHRTEWDQPFG
ncbi:MAG: ANTAR domain-containing protein [Gemmatimonadota bacterium]|nr:ANTAR domain-containing protein [Gemmatimonadota bacterium]